MIRRLIFAITLFTVSLFAISPSVTAFSIFGGACSGGTGDSAVCKTANSHSGTNNPLVGPDGLLTNITNIVAFVAGAAAVIMILVSAIKFITSGSDVSTGARTDTDVEEARRGLANALIGLAVIVLARTIIVFVLSKL